MEPVAIIAVLFFIIIICIIVFAIVYSKYKDKSGDYQKLRNDFEDDGNILNINFDLPEEKFQQRLDGIKNVIIWNETLQFTYKGSTFGNLGPSSDKLTYESECLTSAHDVLTKDSENNLMTYGELFRGDESKRKKLSELVIDSISKCLKQKYIDMDDFLMNRILHIVFNFSKTT